MQRISNIFSLFHRLEIILFWIELRSILYKNSFEVCLKWFYQLPDFTIRRTRRVNQLSITEIRDPVIHETIRKILLFNEIMRGWVVLGYKRFVHMAYFLFDRKLKLNPSVNLSNLMFPCGKNLRGVCGTTCCLSTSGAIGFKAWDWSLLDSAFSAAARWPAKWPARLPASKCWVWWVLSYGFTNGDVPSGTSS